MSEEISPSTNFLPDAASSPTMLMIRAAVDGAIPKMTISACP
jgi:hypothetical protein